MTTKKPIKKKRRVQTRKKAKRPCAACEQKDEQLKVLHSVLKTARIQLADAQNEARGLRLQLNPATDALQTLRRAHDELQRKCAELLTQCQESEARFRRREKDPGYFDELFTARKLLAAYSRRIGDLERIIQTQEARTNMPGPYWHEPANFQSVSIWA